MEKKSFVFEALPANLEELKARPEADLKDPFGVLALFMASLCAYPKDRDSALEMIDYLKGPRPLSAMDKQFLRDRFMDGKTYLGLSYFAGATPANNYTPQLPLTITVEDQAHSRDQFSEGYLKLFVVSGGADSPRGVTLRTKPSTGEWFIWEFSSVVAGMRLPAAKDDWA
jgi:hypothetical protein